MSGVTGVYRVGQNNGSFHKATNL